MSIIGETNPYVNPRTCMYQGGVIEGVEAIYFPLPHAQHRREVMRSSATVNQVL